MIEPLLIAVQSLDLLARHGSDGRIGIPQQILTVGQFSQSLPVSLIDRHHPREFGVLTGEFLIGIRSAMTAGSLIRRSSTA